MQHIILTQGQRIFIYLRGEYGVVGGEALQRRLARVGQQQREARRGGPARAGGAPVRAQRVLREGHARRQVAELRRVQQPACAQSVTCGMLCLSIYFYI